ncbi:SDR family NAD(P)-dependent oxidoreductase [Lelliottia sp. RWM.1]|uniref:SDR family NAD(P)-dependent oxidoreductase n=1 Tax=Lelliottia sp. RWM.1 TaxID=2663242 RepID=UPI00193D768B|nr:SDR family NAD(P)-dependent oxidoreductase [Lelliottia sp. RWM.1]MBM3072753.1 SDR family oxidoreductase [Lelliottia sp. RWM.1]
MTLNEPRAERPHMLLIGASRGIGFAMAEELLHRGWNVTATVRSTNAALHALSARYPLSLTVEHLDMTDTAQLADLKTRLRYQRYDTLFVNAGIANQNQSETIAEVSTEEFVHVMITNALSPLRVIDAFQAQVTADGLIGVMSSGQGSISNNEKGGKEVYRGTKAALNQYMRSYAARQALKTPDRALLLLAPGWIRTDLGGEDGAFSLTETIPDIVSVIERKRSRPGLEFLDRFGKVVPW